MAFKKIREAVVQHIGRLPVYVYEDRDGVSTLVDRFEAVQIVTKVTDGPDKGREVRVKLTRAEAVEHIEQVWKAIRAAETAEGEGV